jgi:hypothetical protein
MIVGQVRYYNESDKALLNQPLGVTADQLANGTTFDTVYNEIRVQTYPGTILTLNGEEVHIGEIGIYNILYPENVSIVSIQVNRQSIEFIRDNKDAYLIITFMTSEDTTTSSSNSSSNSSGTDSGSGNNGEGNNSGNESSSKKDEAPPSDNHDSRKEDNNL